MGMAVSAGHRPGTRARGGSLLPVARLGRVPDLNRVSLRHDFLNAQSFRRRAGPVLCPPRRYKGLSSADRTLIPAGGRRGHVDKGIQALTMRCATPGDWSACDIRRSQRTMTQKELFEPTLTLPEAEAEYLKAAYSRAGCILEYGSGGSTVVAARLGHVQLFSVESDADWARNLQGWIAREGIGARATIWHQDIGRTREWGHPAQYRRADALRYYRYANEPWTRLGGHRPDIVLIDGRFRIGCFIATAANIRKPTRILFDDYANRPHYSFVEQIAPLVERVGRMAIFDLKPRRFGAALKLRHAPKFLDAV